MQCDPPLSSPQLLVIIRHSGGTDGGQEPPAWLPFDLGTTGWFDVLCVALQGCHGLSFRLYHALALSLIHSLILLILLSQRVACPWDKSPKHHMAMYASLGVATQAFQGS